MSVDRPKAIVPAVFALSLLAVSCPSVPVGRADTGPDSTPPADAVAQATPWIEDAPPDIAPFDPSAVSAEVKQTTIVDVRTFIDKLNAIIRNKDYESWTSHLTDVYYAHYSDPAVLAEMSNDPALKRYGVVLRTLRDYFSYVVYPSRQNSRVDDIEFLDKTRIKVIWVDAKGERLVLYNLEKIGDTWKIAIWR